MKFHFELQHQSKKSRARVGQIHTPHGVIQTPGFVAVGTNGVIKALDSRMVNEIGLDLIFCNTYHLLLQPGVDVVEQAGGLHKFIHRNFPIITDSGGFQVFSLAYGSVADELKSRGKKKTDGQVLKIEEKGVTFRSYRDGRKIVLTPESSIQAQKSLGADIILPLDELPPYHMEHKELTKSLKRTHRWEKRSLEEHLKNPANQAMYGIIHGGIDPDLRKESCKYLSSLNFDGYAIGGSVGKNLSEMLAMLSVTVPQLPWQMPVHLLGIGDLDSIEKAITLGIDTFDSSYPTKAARHGVFFLEQGKLKITSSINKNMFEPVDKNCMCWTCRHYTRAYLHHLFKSKELIAYTLATIHNLHFMMCFMDNLRRKIFLNLI